MPALDARKADPAIGALTQRGYTAAVRELIVHERISFPTFAAAIFWVNDQSRPPGKHSLPTFFLFVI